MVLGMNKQFMEMALDIAFTQMGLTSPNPPVGAVIVKNDSVIAKGGTRSYGCNHAEIEAINNAGIDLKDAEMYVSLEPCSHFGKTPPCADAIIKAGIKKVYIPLQDPNPQVAGRGIHAIKTAGVTVEIVTG